MHRLSAYRQLALAQFQKLLLSLPEKASEADYFVDQVIRSLSNLPSRPETALPYGGLYGKQPDLDEYREYRDVAVDRLKPQNQLNKKFYNYIFTSNKVNKIK